MTRYHLTYKDKDTELIEAEDDSIVEGTMVFRNVTHDSGAKHIVIPLCALKRVEVIVDESAT